VTADELPAPPPPPGPTPAGLWSWGQNTNGQLGLNDRVARSSPVQVGALTNWYVPIGIGNHLVLTDVSKKLWSCGANTNGNLGQNDTVNRSSPTQVGADTTWSNKTVSGGSATFSIKTDGTLWSWGLNSSGQLGQNNAINRSSPVQVGALTNWGYIHSTGSSVMSVKTDGTLWSWGFNGSGQLGQNDIIDRSSPVQVGSDTNWSKCKINSVISIVSKANGTLWACGNGAYGRTGLGIATSNSSPIQIGSDTNWSKISISTDGSANYGGFAIKTTGAMWVWGRNNYGSLGLNNVNPQSTPIQLGLLTNWSKVSAGDNAVMAIKTDGSLWAIGGRNQLGQLGLNDTINRSSPVQVGAGTTWQDISGGSSRFSGTKA
jgi:alpha-tubulin suppressor-like RCC1 family protein